MCGGVLVCTKGTKEYEGRNIMLAVLTPVWRLDVGRYAPMMQPHESCGKKYRCPRLCVGLAEMMKWYIKHGMSIKRPPNFSDRAS